MTASVVVYTPEVKAQLASLFDYVYQDASASVAQRFIDSIVHQCERLDMFPDRGAPREDIRPGLRTLSFKRVLIAYFAAAPIVTVVGIFYGGQDYETILAGGEN